MKEKYLKLLFKVNPNMSEKDKNIFQDIMNDEGLGRCKPIFNLYGFLFGFFYLLYKKAYLEGIAVLLVALMVGYFYLPGIIIMNSLLGGFCYYFLYLNKFNSDIDRCGGVSFPNIDCLKKKSKESFIPVIVAVILILILVWPVLFSIITGHTLKGAS